MKSNKIDKMKEDYNQIKIPANLEETIKKSIDRAKEENKILAKSTLIQEDRIEEDKSSQVEGKKAFYKFFVNEKVVRFVRRASQVATAAIILIAILANSSDTFLRTVQNVPFLGGISNAVVIGGGWGSQEATQSDTAGELMVDVAEAELAVDDSENLAEDSQYNEEAAIESPLPEVAIEGEQSKLESLKGEQSNSDSLIGEQSSSFSAMEDSAIESGTEELKGYGRAESGVSMLDAEDGSLLGETENACTSGLIMSDIFIEGSDYLEFLSSFMEKETTKETYQVTGEEYIYFNGEEDLVLLIEGKEDDGMVEIIIPREEIEDILKN